MNDELTIEQRKVLQVLKLNGKAPIWVLANDLSDYAIGFRWSNDRVRRVMKQLKYRSLVKYQNGTWRPLETDNPL